jgi:ElaB/YqjD/DUF883 family membrane-anchored ribosome-binding protein
MSTGSTASENARDTANDARDAAREFGKAASDSAANFEGDLQALRDDFRRLADQVADILAGKGAAAWRHAKAGVNEAVSEAQDKGQEAAKAVREISDHFVGALDESIKTRPYTTLALAAGLAFLFGAAWRR